MPTPAVPPMEPQAALEQAACDYLLARLGETFGYTAKNLGRNFDGRPPPYSGLWYVSVWHTGERSNNPSARDYLDERHGLSVTLSYRVQAPFDRRVVARDEMERRMNAVRAALHGDCSLWVVSNAAGELANIGHTLGRKGVGFIEGLQLTGLSEVNEVGPDWFQADSRQSASLTGFAQTASFQGPRRMQTGRLAV